MLRRVTWLALPSSRWWPRPACATLPGWCRDPASTVINEVEARLNGSLKTEQAEATAEYSRCHHLVCEPFATRW